MLILAHVLNFQNFPFQIMFYIIKVNHECERELLSSFNSAVITDFVLLMQDSLTIQRDTFRAFIKWHKHIKVCQFSGLYNMIMYGTESELESTIILE